MDAKLPPGVEPAPLGSGDHIVAAEASADPDRVTISDPIMTGMPVQIQHPTSTAEEATKDPGLFAGTVVQSPIGPLLCLQMRHADSTNLTVIMTWGEVAQWDELWSELRDKACLLAAEPEGRS